MAHYFDHAIWNFFHICTVHLVVKNVYYQLMDQLVKKIFDVLYDIVQYCKKVTWSRYKRGVAQRVGSGIALLFHYRCTKRREWSAARPGRTLSPGKTRYSLYRRLGGPQGRSGREENLVPTGIRFRTVQPVVSCYTDWATRPITFCDASHPNLANNT